MVILALLLPLLLPTSRWCACAFFLIRRFLPVLDAVRDDGVWWIAVNR
jgi:hypothetical protein